MCWHFWRVRLSVADKMLCWRCLEKFWHLQDTLELIKELERNEQRIRELSR
jgi:hypothetical protein